MSNTIPSESPTPKKTHTELVALQRARNAAYDKYAEAKRLAEREWTKRRSEIKKELPPPSLDEVRHAQRAYKEAQQRERDAIKQAERERDLLIQKARADCEKKKATIRSETRSVRDAAELVERKHKVRVAEHEKELRAKYAYERPSYFGEASELFDEYTELRNEITLAMEGLTREERDRVYQEAEG